MSTAFQIQALKVSASSLEVRVGEFLEKLASETDAVRQSEAFQDYLNTMARFWKYSFHNQCLIYLQNKNASLVAGFKTWNNLGRKVLAGSKSIKILAPFSKKTRKVDLETGEEKEDSFTYFVPVNVFDISQTQGKEITTLDLCLEGDSHEFAFKKALKYCKELSIQVEFKPLTANFFGYSAGGKIVLNFNHSTNTQLNTLIHELAHELLHKSPESKLLTKQERETQAESISYIVCKALNLQAKSSQYLALQKANSESLKKHFQIVSKTAKEILEKINSNVYLQNSVIVAVEPPS